MTTDSTPPRRLLVFRIGSLGDTLVALPGFHYVRRMHPGAHITLLTSIPINAKAAPMEAILEHTRLYDETLRYPTSLRDLGELRGLRRRLRAGRFDRLYYLAKPRGGLLTSLRDWLFFRSCGIRRVIGVPFTRQTLRCEPIPGSTLHTAEPVRLMAALGAPADTDLAAPEWWDLGLTAAERAAAAVLLAEAGITGPFLAASVGTKVHVNDWEEPNWGQLIDRLSARYPELPLVLFGVKEEADRSERLLVRWKGPGANLCGRSSPRVSAAVLESAAAMVCHDSGPMHLAATVGVPCVAIMSARNRPGEWYPRGDHHTVIYHQTPCWGCKRQRCEDKDKACIRSITVEEVEAAVQHRLTLAGIGAAAAHSPCP